MFTISRGNLGIGIMISIILLTICFKNGEENLKEYSSTITIISLGISYIVFFMAVVISGILNILLGIRNDFVALVFIIIIYCFLLYFGMNVKRLRNGFTFLNKKLQNQIFDFLMINLGAFMLILLVIWENSELSVNRQMFLTIAVVSILMLITIQKSFQVYYKHKQTYHG